jgi:hypothetical protein
MWGEASQPRPHDEGSIAEFVRLIPSRLSLLRRAPQQVIIDERSEQFVVTRPGLVHPRKNRIDDAQS